jgi:hypothetical protein
VEAHRVVRRRGSHISLDNRLADGGKVGAGGPLSPGRFLVLISVKRPSQLQGHSAPGRIRSIEKPNDLIGNRTRNLPYLESCNNFLFCIIHFGITPRYKLALCRTSVLPLQCGAERHAYRRQTPSHDYVNIFVD